MKSKIETYKTILVITVGFIALYFVFHVNYFITIAFAISVLSIVSEWIANLISSLWLKLATLLSYIVPNIIMSLVFFLILTPIALVQKLLKKNTTFRLGDTLNSTFLYSNRSIDKTHFEKPW